MKKLKLPWVPMGSQVVETKARETMARLDAAEKNATVAIVDNDPSDECDCDTCE